MTLFDRYVTAVVSAGFVLLALAVAHGPLPPGADVSMVAILAAVLIVADCMPMRLLHDRSEGEITMSSTFALALLVVGGRRGRHLRDRRRRAVLRRACGHKPAQRMAFNVGQYVLSVAAGAAVLALALRLVVLGAARARAVAASGDGRRRRRLLPRELDARRARRDARRGRRRSGTTCAATSRCRPRPSASCSGSPRSS